jgi:1-acyl-sn-glycerol-3-phosphate acyltransferase
MGGRAVIYWLTRVLARLWCGAHFAIDAQGLERIPACGPAILVLNHPCAIDGVMMVGLIRRKIHSYTRAENARNPIAAWYMRRIGSRAVAPGADNQSASERAAASLRAGVLFGIFAEGDVSTGPTPGPFRPGFMKLAVTTGAPVVPIAIVGTERALRNRRRPSPLDLLLMGRADVRIRVLEPLAFENATLDRDQFDRDVAHVHKLIADRVAELAA